MQFCSICWISPQDNITEKDTLSTVCSVFTEITIHDLKLL